MNISVSDPSPKTWSPILQEIRLGIFGPLPVPKPGDGHHRGGEGEDHGDVDHYDDDDGDDDGYERMMLKMIMIKTRLTMEIMMKCSPSHGFSGCDNMHPTQVDLKPFAPIFSCR